MEDISKGESSIKEFLASVDENWHEIDVNFSKD